MLARRTAVLAALAASLALGGAAPPVQAAGATDTWTRWITSADQRDAWVRSLDFTATQELWAASEGDGVFQSANGGATWSNTPQINGGLFGNAAAMNVRQVVADGAAVYAATTAGLFRRNGGTWVPVGQGAGPGKLNAAVQAIRVSGSTIVAGTASSGIWRSTDSGETWAKAAGVPSSESIWHIVGTAGVQYAAGGGGVYRSLDGGASWTLRSDGIPSSSVLRLGISPINPLHLYAATTGSGVYRSVTGGEVWSDASGTGAQSLPGTVRAMLLAPTGFGAERLIAGTTQGVYTTIDNGKTWARMATTSALGEPAMSNQIVWSLGFSPIASPGFLMAGTQANGVYRIPFTPVLKSAGTLPTTGAETTKSVGAKLTASPGGWTGSDPIFFAFQWQRCTTTNENSCSDIDGANGETYVLTSSDNGKRVRVRVSATGLVPPAPAAVFSAISAQVTNDILNQPPNPSTTPSLSPNDTSKPWGTTFTIGNGAWPAGTTFAREWERCDENGLNCKVIPGATGASYTTTSADANRKLRGWLLATKDGATTRSLAGITWLVIERKPVNTTLPVVAGDPYPGAVLDSSAGGWVGNGITYFRQWQVCEADGSGCTSAFSGNGQQFTILGIHKGKRLRIRIEARNGQGSNFVEYATSVLTPVITDPPVPAAPAAPAGDAPAPAPAPASGGGAAGVPQAPVFSTPKLALPRKLKVGAKVAAPAKVAGATSVRYQWLRNGKAIRRATKRTYRITRADRGRKLAVRLTLTLPGGAKKTVTSKAVKVPRR